VRKGDVCALPFADASYDLVCATDVIEHVDDDELALAEISRVLRPGAYALLTVPTFASLWGLQDERAQHKRRYRLAELVARVEAAHLVAIRFYYFNYLLFVPIWTARQIIRLAAIRLGSENEVNTPAINRLLTAIFRFDCLTAPRLRPPFGVSALIAAQKP
jgi:ubiquinone/menaquinone biosynthesis C-methylase UbiE